MTIDIDAIRRREQAATDGPWWAWNRGVGYVIAIGTPSDVDEYDRPQRELPEGMRTDIGRESDAEFIAHARTDIPAILAELAAAKAEHKVHNNACVEEKEDLRAQLRAQRAEIEQLRAKLADAPPAWATFTADDMHGAGLETVAAEMERDAARAELDRVRAELAEAYRNGWRNAANTPGGA